MVSDVEIAITLPNLFKELLQVLMAKLWQIMQGFRNHSFGESHERALSRVALADCKYIQVETIYVKSFEFRLLLGRLIITAAATILVHHSSINLVCLNSYLDSSSVVTSSLLMFKKVKYNLFDLKQNIIKSLY